MQLVSTAKFKGVTEVAVWEYFNEVIAPAVLEWQGRQAPEQRSLGSLFLQFVKAAPVSKVMVQMLLFEAMDHFAANFLQCC